MTAIVTTHEDFTTEAASHQDDAGIPRETIDIRRIGGFLIVNAEGTR
jgi:hypothetical protein